MHVPDARLTLPDASTEFADRRQKSLIENAILYSEEEVFS